jgi:hypothetical protein
MSLQAGAWIPRLPGSPMRTTLRRLFITSSLLFAGPSLAADDTFTISKTDAEADVGAKTKASVTITAKKGWHLNAEAPITLKLTPVPGLALDKSTLARADLALSSETAARFDIGLTLSEPGKKLIEGEAGFVLCQEDACRPVKQKLTLAALGTAPKAAPAKKPGKKQSTSRTRAPAP